jgi:hypothetical protein
MKYFSILAPVLVITLLISACGANATPPPAISAVDMQLTSAAVALTMFAETQAAVPTATPQPTETITNTPAPTNTFIPVSSLTAAATENPGNADPCEDKVLPPVLEGKTVKLRINNSTKASVNVSVYLNRTIPPAVCGYRAYTLEPGNSLVINDMVEGCFTIWAWNPDPEGYFMVTNGAASCIDSSYPVAFDVSTRDIRQR